MSNEEKAREIANTYSSDVLQAGAYFGAEKMADWKDQQFKEYLKKKKHALDNYSFDELNGAYCVIDEIINDLFKND